MLNVRVASVWPLSGPPAGGDTTSISYGTGKAMVTFPTRSAEKFLGDQHVAYSALHHQPAYTAQEEASVACAWLAVGKDGCVSR